MRRAGTPLLIAVAALTGCGGDVAPVRAPGNLARIAIDDYRQHPAAVQVRRGLVTFRVANRGRVPHNFAVRGPSGRVRLQISTLLPGESAAGTTRLPRGEFRMYCALANHEELGEYGTIVVR